MVDSDFVADPDIALDVVRQRLDDIGALLRSATVFFAVKDQDGNPARVAGSGVVADLHGTKVVLTAGHVLRDFRRDFEDCRMMISVNQPRGSFALRPDCERLISTGGVRGADAGVVILPPDQVEAYFQFGGFEPTRATTLLVNPPPLGVACILGGFPAQGTEFFSAEGPGGTYSWAHATLKIVAARLVHSDELHHWLDISKPPPDVEPFEPGEFNGMSGCGFWSLRVKKDLTTTPPSYEVRAHLHGVHTATVDDDVNGLRLRQTPIRHHLALLAEHRPDLKLMLMRLWPELGGTSSVQPSAGA